MTGLLQRSRSCRVVLAKRWVVGSFPTTNIHRRSSLRFECLSLSLRTTTGTRMTSSTLVQAQRDAALNPVSRFNTEIVFSFDNLSFWRSVSLKIISSTRTSGLKKLQRRSHHSYSVSRITWWHLVRSCGLSKGWPAFRMPTMSTAAPPAGEARPRKNVGLESKALNQKEFCAIGTMWTSCLKTGSCF